MRLASCHPNRKMKAKDLCGSCYDKHLKLINRSIKKKYNLYYVDYLLMKKNQNNSCALCFRKEGLTKLHIYHNHETGKVRGLLCHQCNWLLKQIQLY